MATAPTTMTDTDRPLHIRQIADDFGLLPAEVRTLINDHAVASYRVGRSRVVAASDWPRLSGILRRYLRRKARAEGAA